MMRNCGRAGCSPGANRPRLSHLSERGSAMRRPALLTLLAATTALTLAFAVPSRAAEDAVVIPTPTMDATPASDIQTAVIAGGCFWGVQGVFQHTAGVVNAV